MRIDWPAIIPVAIEQARRYLKRVGTPANLRGLFYALVSIGKLPNTRSAYKKLSQKLSEARKAGAFPWRLLQDTTRRSFNREAYPVTLKRLERRAAEAASDALSRIRDAFDDIEDPGFDFEPFKWEGQPKRVAICVEKEGAARAIASLTREWSVEVNAMRGYSSTTNLKRLADRLLVLEEDHAVEVLLVTDYDPSGEDIARFVKESLWHDYGVEANVEKVLLTREQIDEYDLPGRPEDAAERAKMRRDPRFKGWHEGYFRVELDSMLAIEPEAFREIMVGAIERHFDDDVREKVQEKARDLQDEAEDRMADLAGRLADLMETVKGILDGVEEELEET